MSAPIAGYEWLQREPGPRMLLELLALHGTREKIGAGSNPEILGWAKELGLEKIYRDDATPWCGLGMAIAAKRAGWAYMPGGDSPLWARNWANWGTKQKIAMLGDVLVFERGSGGHVGQCVGDDATHYHVLGANQGDAVSIVRIPKRRCIAIRRAPWRVAQPDNVRRVPLSAAGGPVSSKED